MTFEFQVTLKGEGNDLQEAWNNAVEAFGQDPGVPPENAARVDNETDDF